jgi:hypothetical protein
MPVATHGHDPILTIFGDLRVNVNLIQRGDSQVNLTPRPPHIFVNFRSNATSVLVGNKWIRS